MFKKNCLLVFFSVLLVSVCQGADKANLITNSNWSDNFKGWYVPYLDKCDSLSVKTVSGKNILFIKGAPELGKKNGYIKCARTLRLSKDEISGKKFIFGVTVKAVKVSGRLMFAVREIDGKGKSVKYQAIRFKKRDKFDWKKCTKTFTASPKTVKLAIYIIAQYLQKDDDIQAKDIYLEKVLTEKTK